MKFLILVTLFFSFNSFAGAYFGLNVGYTGYSSEALDQYHVVPKGTTYGGFFGFGKDILGLEFIYQNLSTSGKIKHDGAKQTITENATAMGGALRISLNYFYLRGGLVSYTLDQKIDIADPTTRTAADDVYDVHKKGARQNGSLYGGGLHTKWGVSRVFIDFTRYQVGSVGHYDAVAVGISFPISDKIFSFSDK